MDLLTIIRPVLDRLPHDTLYIGGEPYMRRWYLAGHAPAPTCPTCLGHRGDPDYEPGPGDVYNGVVEPGSVPPCPTCDGWGVVGNPVPGHRPTRKGWWWNWGVGAVRIHQILTSDDSRAFHDHPWPFVSIGLRGSYTEVTPLTVLPDAPNHEGDLYASPVDLDGNPRRRFRAPFINVKRANDLHVLEVEQGPVWTLVAMGRKARKWGFAGPFGWLNYEEFDRRYPERNAYTRTGLTTDRSDPRLGHGVDDRPVGQHEVYLVLSDEERARGFVRPVRRSYRHLTCGSVTTMSTGIAETYAANPAFYGATLCVACSMHRPVGPDGEFVWLNPDGTDVEGDLAKVGS